MAGAFFFKGIVEMWKIVLGFIVFAALAIFLLNRGGDIDISGEKHGVLKSAVPVCFAGCAAARI